MEQFHHLEIISDGTDVGTIVKLDGLRVKGLQSFKVEKALDSHFLLQLNIIAAANINVSQQKECFGVE